MTIALNLKRKNNRCFKLSKQAMQKLVFVNRSFHFLRTGAFQIECKKNEEFHAAFWKGRLYGQILTRFQIASCKLPAIFDFTSINQRFDCNFVSNSSTWHRISLLTSYIVPNVALVNGPFQNNLFFHVAKFSQHFSVKLEIYKNYSQIDFSGNSVF